LPLSRPRVVGPAGRLSFSEAQQPLDVAAVALGDHVLRAGVPLAFGGLLLQEVTRERVATVSLPLPVRRKRFFVALCVFIFGIHLPSFYFSPSVLLPWRRSL
jgi:hypothetical protein